jgi:micrococcal nuclease
VVTDETEKSYTFAEVTLAADERVVVHTGSGVDTATNMYWGASGAVWNNDGDTVTVRNSTGIVVAERSY